jgi:hypothetical protein
MWLLLKNKINFMMGKVELIFIIRDSMASTRIFLDDRVPYAAITD